MKPAKPAVKIEEETTIEVENTYHQRSPAGSDLLLKETTLEKAES